MNKTNHTPMHHTIFIEDDDSDPRRLSLWRNKDNELFIEIRSDQEEDPALCQFITLDLVDAKVLLAELTKVVKDMADEYSPKVELSKASN